MNSQSPIVEHKRGLNDYEARPQLRTLKGKLLSDLQCRILDASQCEVRCDKAKTALWQLSIGVDQLANALIGGWADETLSSRAYRASRKVGSWYWKIAATCINGLFFDRTHCKKAYLSECEGLQLPAEFSQKNTEGK